MPDWKKPIKQASDIVSRTTGAVTGRNVEDKIIEYSEVYGEILLGMHTEHQRQQEQITKLTEDVDKLINDVKIVEALRSEVRFSRCLSICTIILLLIVAAIGWMVMIWTKG